MKKLFLLLLVCCGLTFESKSQYVAIPDVNFRNYLSSQYPSCFNTSGNMDTTCSIILQVDSISIDNDLAGIMNLDGIQYFKNLRYLNCFTANYFVPYYLDRIPKLPPVLEVLYCSGNVLTSLPALPVSLQRLNCSWGRLTMLPALPGSLIDLDCSNNQLGSLPQLPGTLQSLRCESNSIVTLPDLPNSLSLLTCGSNQLGALPALPASLWFLDCSFNNLYNLPALQHTSLHTLECSLNSIATMPPLPPSLNSLNCSGNLIQSLPSFPQVLQTINCAHNRLQYLPPLPSAITSLICGYNNLDELPAFPPLLREVQCEYAGIHCLPVIPATVQWMKIDTVNIKCTPSFCNFTIPVPGTVWDEVSVTLPLCSPVNNVNHCEAFPVIAGTVFFDANNNHVRDGNEPLLENQAARLSNGNITYTNRRGYFEIGADSLGSYTMTTLPPPHFLYSPSSVSYQFTSYDTLVTADYALQVASQADSLVLTCTPMMAAAKPGFSFAYQVNTVNAGTTILQPELLLNYDANKLVFDSASVPNVINTGNGLAIHINDLHPWEQETYQFYFHVKTTVHIGDSLTANATVSANNTIVVARASSVIRGSFDPNDKNATPQLSPSQVAAGQYIDYTIRFQNTGNDTAFNIVITDTLSSDLQAATFRMKGASHTCKTTVKGNVVYFEFLNILLADKTSNEPLSHGFVTFSIQPRMTVATNSTINNKAAIYFDYNAPIITNTAGTLIKEFAVLPLHLVSFTAVPQINNSTALSWNTSNEVNSKHFVIEQSSDARNFVAIATVLAKGNASNQYNSTAIDLNNSLVYYRLKMVDRDGVFTYSPVIKIDRRKNTAGFNVLSNPVKDVLIIYTNDPQLNGSSCSIINTQGAVVKQFILQPGNQSVDVKALPHGMYYLKTNNGSSRILLQ